MNRRITVLQTAALPLGYAAIKERVSDFTRCISYLERETGFEPATSTLARLHSTAELFPHRICYNINPYVCQWLSQFAFLHTFVASSRTPTYARVPACGWGSSSPLGPLECNSVSVGSKA